MRISGDESMRFDCTKLGKEVRSGTGGGLSDPPGLGAVLNTVLQSLLCEIKPYAFVPNNVVFTFVQQLKKAHISFLSLF